MRTPLRRPDLACLLAVSILISSPITGAFTEQAGSWALGLVVPDGSRIEGPNQLRWGGVTNITARVVLPAANFTDNTILAVLSVMLSDGSVLQVSAGLFPGFHAWRGAGWFIRDISMSPQDYVWVLNSTEPAFPPGSDLSLSIYLSGSGWNYLVYSHSGNALERGRFTDSAPRAPKPGDQEVFALESYTSTPEVLQNLGNLTLVSLLLDGKTVTGGTYFISDWDPSHQPLFVVGGLPSPSTIAVDNYRNGTFSWSYSVQWKPIEFVPEGTWFFLALAGVSVFTVGTVLALAKKRRRGPSSDA